MAAMWCFRCAGPTEEITELVMPGIVRFGIRCLTCAHQAWLGERETRTRHGSGHL